VAIHVKSEEYDLEGFMVGMNSLHQVELDILGDVAGKSLLHIQCPTWLNAINWARIGAKATGVDFSETAIEFATEIAKKVEADAEFACSNVYDLPQVHEGALRRLFHQIGVLCWLQDIDGWGASPRNT